MERGFTLVETLIAIAIFALVGAIAYTGLDRAMVIRNRLHAIRATWEGRALTYDRLRADLAQARPRPVRNSVGTLVPAFRIRRNAGTTTLSMTVGGSAPLGRPHASNLRRVAYVVKKGRLSWRRWAALDRAPGTRSVTLVLMRHIRRVRLRVLSPEGRLVQSWPLPGQPATLPVAVRMTLVLDNGHSLRWFFPVGR